MSDGWSDETKIELLQKKKKLNSWCVRRRKNDELHPKNTIPTIKHNDGANDVTPEVVVVMNE